MDVIAFSAREEYLLLLLLLFFAFLFLLLAKLERGLFIGFLLITKERYPNQSDTLTWFWLLMWFGMGCDSAQPLAFTASTTDDSVDVCINERMNEKGKKHVDNELLRCSFSAPLVHNQARHHTQSRRLLE